MGLDRVELWLILAFINFSSILHSQMERHLFLTQIQWAKMRRALSHSAVVFAIGNGFNEGSQGITGVKQAA